ncbi:MAG TPA: ABC transporter ATP-binding protein [Stellaceae bacterium]|nr:ABC transporter ATP-binding protein [Stellaceae bacterium]
MSALVQAERLSRWFPPRGLLARGPAVQAVTEVDLAIGRGERVGLVGESGSGKSTLGRLLLGLIPPSAGRVTIESTDLAALGAAAMRSARRRMQLIFQDPYSSLDPRRRIGAQIADGLAIHGIGDRRERAQRVRTLLAQVGLSAAHGERYPHEFSGGQRQRISIARALATGPDFLVADEPVSALDVSVQAQVLALLGELCARSSVALLFISHDLPVVRSLCERVVVLYLGRVMEEGPAAAVLARPYHPYTQALISAAPSIDPMKRRRRILLQGDPPSPTSPPSGCVFRTRCRYAVAACGEAAPALREREPGHRVACIRDDVDGSLPR